MKQPSPTTLGRVCLVPPPPSSRSHGHITGGSASGTLSLASWQLGATLGGSPFSLLSLARKDTPAAALDQCQSCGALLMGVFCVKVGTPHTGIMGHPEFHCLLPACASLVHVGCADVVVGVLQEAQRFTDLLGDHGKPVWPLWELMKWLVGMSSHTLPAIGNAGRGLGKCRGSGGVGRLLNAGITLPV